MPASIGVNLRVTGHCRQGGRKYMEDFFSVAYQQTEDERDLEYAFFGIYDGHGGAEAAAFAKEHLMETIIKHRYFWSDNDEDVLRAIKDGYIATHYNMWKEQEKWPKTTSGLPSTAGTTASVAFIRRGKIYIGHVGDSGIILGYQEPGNPEWKAKQLTRDHKPENADEMMRIEKCGGKVVAKSGVPRVVWNRPRIGHQGPVRRSTPIDEIPFLAVARSLGDLWSYNSQINQFIVSPDPDCSVIPIDCNMHRCLIFGTDGLYNMLSPQMAVHIVQQAERHNENAALSDNANKTWLNPSKLLVEKALERWHSTKMRADNTSVVTLMLDPPGPPRAQVLKNRKKNSYPDSGLKIMTRYENERQGDGNGNTSAPVEAASNETSAQPAAPPALNTAPTNPMPLPSISEFTKNHCVDTKSEGCEVSVHSLQQANPQTETMNLECKAQENTPVTSSDNGSLNAAYPLKERNFVPKLRESTSFDPRETCPAVELEEKENLKSKPVEDDNTIQINEISSSSSDLLEACDDENDQAAKSTVKSAKESGSSPVSERSLKPNLRSSSVKQKSSCDKENNVAPSKPKRKISQSTGSSPIRKSSRIDERKKSPDRDNKGSTKRKLAASAAKLSITQKILKSKKLSLKKKMQVKKAATSKNIKLVLQSMKKVQLKNLQKKVKTSSDVLEVSRDLRRQVANRASSRSLTSQRSSVRKGIVDSDSKEKPGTSKKMGGGPLKASQGGKKNQTRESPAKVEGKEKKDASTKSVKVNTKSMGKASTKKQPAQEINPGHHLLRKVTKQTRKLCRKTSTQRK